MLRKDNEMRYPMLKNVCAFHFVFSWSKIAQKASFID